MNVLDELNARYPLYPGPHTSVSMQNKRDRAVFVEGWDAAKKAQEQDRIDAQRYRMVTFALSYSDSPEAIEMNRIMAESDPTDMSEQEQITRMSAAIDQLIEKFGPK